MLVQMAETYHITVHFRVCEDTVQCFTGDAARLTQVGRQLQRMGVQGEGLGTAKEGAGKCSHSHEEAVRGSVMKCCEVSPVIPVATACAVHASAGRRCSIRPLPTPPPLLVWLCLWLLGAAQSVHQRREVQWGKRCGTQLQVRAGGAMRPAGPCCTPWSFAVSALPPPFHRVGRMYGVHVCRGAGGGGSVTHSPPLCACLRLLRGQAAAGE